MINPISLHISLKRLKYTDGSVWNIYINLISFWLDFVINAGLAQKAIDMYFHDELLLIFDLVTCVDISMGESNTVVNAYTQYCSHP